MDLQTLIKKLELNESTISTVLGGLVLFVVATLMFSYFRGGDKLVVDNGAGEIGETGLSEQGSISATSVSRYTVKKGDTLWRIAETNYGDGYKWKEIDFSNHHAPQNSW